MGIKQWFSGRNSRRELNKIKPLVDKVFALEEKYQKFSDDELRGETRRFQQMFKVSDIAPDMCDLIFDTANVKESLLFIAAARVADDLCPGIDQYHRHPASFEAGMPSYQNSLFFIKI